MNTENFDKNEGATYKTKVGLPIGENEIKHYPQRCVTPKEKIMNFQVKHLLLLNALETIGNYSK